MATDTLWIDFTNDKLFWLDGQFTSTINDEQDISGVSGQPRGISSTDTDDVIWIEGGDAGSDRIHLQSGRFTSTIKDSQDLTNTNSRPQDASLDINGDVVWCGDEESGFGSTLYLMSGMFSSTIKDSEQVEDTIVGCCSNENGDVPWCRTAGELKLTSGSFTSTIKTSIDIASFETNPRGVSWNGLGDTLVSGIEADKLYKLSGQFTTTIHDSEDVSVSSPQGIDTTDYSARTSAVPSSYDTNVSDSIAVAETVNIKVRELHVSVVDSITIVESFIDKYVLSLVIKDIDVADSINIIESIEASPPLMDGYNSPTYYRNVHEDSMLGQTFTATGTYEVTSIRCKFARNGILTENAHLYLYTIDEDGFPTGSPMCYIEFDPSAYSALLSWYEYALSSYLVLESGKSYAVVVAYDFGDEDNCLRWGTNTDTPTPYSSGCAIKNVGPLWYTFIPQIMSEDFSFGVVGSYISQDYTLRDKNDLNCLELSYSISEQQWATQQIIPEKTYTLKYIDLALYSSSVYNPQQNMQVYIVKLQSDGLPAEAEAYNGIPRKVLAEVVQPAYKVWRKLNDLTPWTHFELDTPVILYAGCSYSIVVKLSKDSEGTSIYWGGDSGGINYNGQVAIKPAGVNRWNTLSNHNMGFKLFGANVSGLHAGDAVAVDEYVAVQIAGVDRANIFVDVKDKISVKKDYNGVHIGLTRLVNQGAQSDNSDYDFYLQNWPAILFPAAGDFWVTRIGVLMGKTGTPTGDGYIGIRYTDSDNFPTTTVTWVSFEVSDLQTTPQMEYFDLPPAKLNAGQMYAITIATPSSTAGNYITCRYLNPAVLGDAHWCTTANWGATWTMATANTNMVFEIFGYADKGAGELDIEMVKGVDTYSVAVTNQYCRGQNFTPNIQGWLTGIDLPIYATAGSTGSLQVELYDTDGDRLPNYWGNQPGLGEEELIDVSALGNVAADPMSWYHHEFSKPIYLSDSAHYAIVLNRTTAGSGTVYWGGCDSTPPLAGHESLHSDDFGENWTKDDLVDMSFRTYMLPVGPPELNISIDDAVSISESLSAGRPIEIQSDMDTGYAFDGQIYGANLYGQVFYPETDYLFTDFSIYGNRVGSPGICNISVYKVTNDVKPLGRLDIDYLASVSEDVDEWLTDLEWHKLSFDTPTVLYAGQGYVFVISCPDGADANNCIEWGIDNSNTDNAGAMIYSTDDGLSWIVQSAYSPYYRIYGSSSEWDIDIKLKTKHDSDINTFGDIHVSLHKAQTFQVDERVLCDKVAVGLTSDIDTYGYIVAELYNTDGAGKPLTDGYDPIVSGTIETGVLPSRIDRPIPWSYANFATPADLTPGVTYALVLRKMPVGGEG